MSDFSAIVARWGTFYFAMAGVSGTLLGLLFVGVSLSVRVINDEKYADLHSIANQSYINYMFLLLFSLVFLIPDVTVTGLGIPLLLLGAAGLLATVQQIVITNRHRQHPIRHAYVRWPVLMPVVSLFSLIGFVMLIIVCVLLLGRQPVSFGLMVIPLLLLTYAAAQTTWDFLTKRGTIAASDNESSG